MTTQHTPGPWIWGDNFKGLYGAGPNNEVLDYASYEGMWLGYGSAMKANARLIAAAPDLLEALQAISNPSLDDFSRSCGFEKARAAIAKATGDQA